MPAGLGKNSPVILSFGKASYEALIFRHGQFIRWRIAQRCTCLEPHTSQFNPRCPRCDGKGFVYSFQPQMIITAELMVSDDTNILEIPEGYKDCTLDVVFDYFGRKYPAEKHGKYITIKKLEMPAKGSYLTIKMTENTAKGMDEADCENTGGGYYRINGLRFRKDGIEGIYYTAPADIIKITKIIDAAGQEYQAHELRMDLFCIVPNTKTITDDEGKETKEEIPITEPLTAYGIEYVPPFIFALMSQNLSKEDVETLVASKGDAVLTFPYNCDVSEGDILTALSGSLVQKEALKRQDEDDDIIGAYFVSEIISCIGQEREYKIGTDFILIGTNYLRWLCEDAPEQGDVYSLTYRVCPTYKVVKSIPQIRTSENQRLPKKAIVQYHGTYGENRKVNQQ